MVSHVGESHPLDVDYLKLHLFEMRHWSWTLNPNQSYLGRTVFALKRSCTGSLNDLSFEEWNELYHCIRLFEAWMDQTFRPDKYNYTQMGNVWEQMHVHAIPRYRGPRTWQGIRIDDVRWGQNTAPTPRSPISIERTYELADWLRTRLSSFEVGTHAKASV
jgi:diadenosine tetraphosphate (Ap4A) HIT family hydrolase